MRRDPSRIEYVNGNQAHTARRNGNEPAPTLHFGARMNEVTWQGDLAQRGDPPPRVPEQQDAETAPADLLTEVDAVDLCAGPGGWDVAADTLGMTVLGVELDDAACATRAAAGLRTLQADVAALDPVGDLPPARGLIGSPPCQTFSGAGAKSARHLMRELVAAIRDAFAGRPIAPHVEAMTAVLERVLDAEARQVKDRVKRERAIATAPARARADAASACLVAQPARYIAARRPEWVALEQVREVLPLWEVYADELRKLGYSVWAGILEAERYGVPQTRERAILLAAQGRDVHPPEPTHQRYVKGEPPRHEVGLFGEMLPWVSMAEALGWGMTERPGMTFAPGTGGGDASLDGGGTGARKALAAERERGAWVVRTGNFTAVVRDADGGRSAAGSVPYERDVSEPAPTVRAAGAGELREVPTHYDRRQDTPRVRPIPVTEPAPTIGAQGLAKGRDVWVHERPATTVNGDPRIAEPGRHDPEVNGSQYGPGTIRVSLEEAAALQTFPPGYPFQGTQTARYRQVGDAVPCLLALRILQVVAPGSTLRDPQPT